MSDKVKVLTPRVIKTFADIPPETRAAVMDKQWIRWEPRTVRDQAFELATKTLTEWLDARAADLVRERVPRESVVIRSNGSRTTIYVDGKARFEFKLKFTMGECNAD